LATAFEEREGSAMSARVVPVERTAATVDGFDDGSGGIAADRIAFAGVAPVIR
jgi:hypothetical protein